MRELSKLNPHELRNRDQISLQKADERISAAQLLDKTENATSISELKEIIIKLITRITGEK